MFAVYILLLADRKRRRRQIWCLIFDLFRGVSVPIPCQFRFGRGQPFRFTFGLLLLAVVNLFG